MMIAPSRHVLLLGVVSATCVAGGAALLYRRGASSPPPVEEQVRPPPRVPAVPETRLICAPGEAVPATKRTIYDFAEDELTPEQGGAFANWMPHRGIPRHVSELARALHGRGDEISRCYDWVREATPEVDGRIDVHLDVDEWGVAEVTGVTPRAEMQPVRAATVLARCVGEALVGLTVEGYTPRRTSATLGVEFYAQATRCFVSGVPRPSFHFQPAKPPGGVCMMGPVVSQLDMLAPEPPVLRVVDNGGPSLRGRSGPRVEIRAASVVVTGTMDTVGLRAAIRSNLGAYRDCYRHALERRPGLTGVVTLRASYSASGKPLSVVVASSTAGDAPLEQCLALAFGKVWLDPLATGSAVEVSYPFRLVPEAAPVQVGDDGCNGHLESLRAALEAAPWMDDARVEQATESLLAYIARYRATPPIRSVEQAGESLLVSIARHRAMPAIRSCVAAAAPDLSRLATTPHRSYQKHQRLGLLETVVARYRQLLAIEPALPNAGELRFYLAEALYRLERWQEAAVEYRQVAVAGGAHAEDAADGAVLSERNPPAFPRVVLLTPLR